MTARLHSGYSPVLNVDCTNTTLIIQLDDGSHRTQSWPRRISIQLARVEIGFYQRLRAHRVVRATLLIGMDQPIEVPCHD